MLQVGMLGATKRNGADARKNEEACRKLLNHLEIKSTNWSKIRLEGFFDIMDEHGVDIEDSEVDAMIELVDEKGEAEKTAVFDFVRQAAFWKVLEKRDVYADPEILKKLTKNTYGMKMDLPQTSKIEEILKQINKARKAFEVLDKDKDGLITKQDFARNFSKLTSRQVDFCFDRFDENKDSYLNFIEFKNFMAKRKPLPNKAFSRCCSVMSLRTMSTLSLAESEISQPPRYSSLSCAWNIEPPKFEDIVEGEDIPEEIEEVEEMSEEIVEDDEVPEEIKEGEDELEP